MRSPLVQGSNSRRVWWIAGIGVIIVAVCCALSATGIGLYAYVAPRVQSTLTAMTAEPYGLPAAQVTELAPNLPPSLKPTAAPPSATNFTNNEGRSEAPQVAWDKQGNLHVVWFDSSLRQSDSYMDVFHRYLRPDGQWSDVSNLTEGFNSTMSGSLFLLTAPNGEVCALWQGSKGATMSPAYYRRCWVNSQWGETENIEVGGEVMTSNIAPAFAPDGTLQMAYNTMGAWYFLETPLIPENSSATGTRLAIDTAGGHHVVWLQYGEGESLQYRFSPDGRTWEASTVLTSKKDAPTGSGRPFQLSTDAQGNLHLAWAGQGGVFYRRWTSNSGWQPTQKIVGSDATFGNSVALAVDAQGQPHILFPLISFGPLALGYVRQQADNRWTDPRVVAITSGGPESIGLEDFVLVIGLDGAPHFVWQVQKFDAGQSISDLYYATLQKK